MEAILHFLITPSAAMLLLSVVSMLSIFVYVFSTSIPNEYFVYSGGDIRYNKNSSRAACGSCYKGEWSSRFPRRPWDGTSKVENRWPLSREELRLHQQSLHKPDKWLEDFCSLGTAEAGSKGVFINKVSGLGLFSLYFSCKDGFELAENKLCHITLIRSPEMCNQHGLRVRDYTTARMCLNNIILLQANCKFNIRECTVTRNLVGGPSEIEHKNLYNLIVLGTSGEDNG